MWVGSCPDNTIEDKILKILGRSKIPEVITDLTANDWRFRDLDLNSENHLHYDVVDLNTKYTDGYDNSYLQMIYGTDSIPEDKLKLISDLLNSTAWYESDYTEQHDLLFPDDNYDATQCIELSMMDDDHIFVMQLIEGENNTSLRIDAQSFFEENGTKYLDAPDDICLEVTDKILMCDDPELIDNIKRIIAG
jgi:hypothetical protein